ncbi:4Fe-4S dicluster domain-containing protein [Variovorax sp. J22R115]|nr:4Fe-4S dicluster domain-containing protein [Variovorax sp. J22R115]MDM0047665.1 4Fe-4S dicluster domain-containing protein [Variovorax sp. J22R115]
MAGRSARPGWQPDVDAARCTGCGWCVAACDLHLLCLEVVDWKKYSTLAAADLCTGCSDCAVKCPFHAISMRRVEPPGIGLGCDVSPASAAATSTFKTAT